MYKVNSEEAKRQQELFSEMINSFDKQQNQHAENNRHRIETVIKEFGNDVGFNKSESELLYGILDGIKNFYDFRSIIATGVQPKDIAGLDFSNGSSRTFGPPYLIDPDELSFPINYLVAMLQNTYEKVKESFDFNNDERDKMASHFNSNSKDESQFDNSSFSSSTLIKYWVMDVLQRNLTNHQSNNPYINENYLIQMQNDIQNQPRQDYYQNPDTPNTV